MRSPRFKKWFAGLPALNQPQRRQVLEALRPAAGLDQLLTLLDRLRAERRCPACASPHWQRHGQANGLQRYRCRDCRRTFNDLSGTPLARLRLRGKWIDYLGALLDSLSVRSSAERTGVHRNTAFRWRHRFLAQLKHERSQRLHGILEADEMFLLESQKGARQLTRPARKRGGTARRRGISRDLDCILVARGRAGAAQQRRRHPCAERECLSPPPARLAHALSRRRLALSAELPGLAQGARRRTDQFG